MLMGKRKHPFGYTMQCGKYVICDSEADTVKSIFTMYTRGMSFTEITTALRALPVKYSEECLWNKNIVARILEDSRYIGFNGYPPIISEQEFLCAAHVRKAKTKPDNRSPAQKLLRKKCDKSPSANTEAQVISVLNLLIKRPDLIQPQDDLRHNNQVDILQKQLDAVMLRQPIDEAVAIKLIIAIAEEQYAQLGNSVYETEKLRRLMLRSEPTDELDADLLSAVVDKVIVDKAHTQVVLKNGQEICSEEAR